MYYERQRNFRANAHVTGLQYHESEEDHEEQPAHSGSHLADLSTLPAEDSRYQEGTQPFLYPR